MQVTLNPLANGALIAADQAPTYAALLIKFPAASLPDQLLYRLFYSGSPISRGRTLDPTLDKLILQSGPHSPRRPIQRSTSGSTSRLEAVDYTNEFIY
jgi:hypothetical protein